MQAMLRAQVDLLWFGGIGTYVKSSRESHADVGDKANDALRINGRDVRARVIGEGANLGVTQFGRIEYARIGAGGTGGKMNTDFIDNSAGVDTSDHEVNIKILLGLAVGDGELTEKQRNTLLPEMTDDVAALVLRDNVFQTQVLSVTGRIAPQLMDAQARFMQYLEKSGRLNRAIEFLPSEEEIADRRGRGQGLSSPERAVLLAYSKIWLYDELLGSTLPDDPWVATALERYFPQLLPDRFGAYMQRHPLRREIIATHVTNSMINRVGSTFVHRLVETTGARAFEVVRAYLLSREIFGMVSLWTAIEALDNKVADEMQSQMLIDTSRQLERGTKWFLRSRRLVDDMAATIEHFKANVTQLAARLPQLLDADERARVDAAAGHYVANRVPRELAERVVTFGTLYATLDIAEIAGSARWPVELVAAIYFDLAHRLGMPWLRDKITALPGDQHWQMLAKGAMLDDLWGLQRSITAAVLAGGGEIESPGAVVEAWQASNGRTIERAAQLLGELRAVPAPDAAMLSVALRELRGLA
jgi:glutamate dehydrogenase